RRDDDHFIRHMLRRDRRSPATVRSIRAIVWANQPPRWRRLLLLPFPGGEQLGFTLRGNVAALRDIPTLLLWGTDDRVFTVLEAPRWANEHIAWFDALHLRQRPLAA